MDVPLGPEARYEQTESISLAFVTALQVLPPRQRRRAHLARRTRVPRRRGGRHARPTVESVNSALKRARAGLQRRLPPTASANRLLLPAPPPSGRSWTTSSARTGRVMSRAGRLAHRRRLRLDATSPARVARPRRRGPLLRRHPGQGRTYDLVPARANGGQLAFGTYLRAPAGARHGAGLLVLTLTGDRICALTRFDSSVLPWFGLPRSLPADRVSGRRAVTGAGRGSIAGSRPGRGSRYARPHADCSRIPGPRARSGRPAAGVHQRGQPGPGAPGRGDRRGRRRLGQPGPGAGTRAGPRGGADRVRPGRAVGGRGAPRAGRRRFLRHRPCAQRGPCASPRRTC